MEQDIKDLLKKSLFWLVAIILAIILLSHFLKAPITKYSHYFVDYLGACGVGLGILLADSLPGFIPPDIFLIFAIAGELEEGWLMTRLHSRECPARVARV